MQVTGTAIFLYYFIINPNMLRHRSNSNLTIAEFHQIKTFIVTIEATAAHLHIQDQETLPLIIPELDRH